MSPSSAEHSGSLSPSQAEQFDTLCDRFEAAWRQGERPPIERFLQEAAEPGRPALLRELLLQEVQQRRQRGEQPRPEDYRVRFPDLDPAWLARELAPRSGPAPVMQAATLHIDCNDTLAAELRGHRLLAPSQLAELAALQTSFPEPRALAEELQRRGWLTAYQVEQLFQGRGARLVLGPYVLLEPLGKGGMGQVFKARHQVMKRLVALKFISKGHLPHGQAVKRFEQEIEALAQLSHPNIVAAYDAGRLEDQHFFALEYVEGTDLARLLKQRGRLPVAEACEYARQVALGLQHAHGHGLVHRDIKPANLLLNSKGVVKILDMGLTRLRYDPGDVGTKRLTQQGMVMGTADYISPEQAVDSSRVDIRSDIYSLGCTLYQLLAGRVPFPKEALTDKLICHREQEPAAVEALRKEVPAALAVVVRKMMAKRRDDRYQTPAEVADALAVVLHEIAPEAAHRDYGRSRDPRC